MKPTYSIATLLLLTLVTAISIRVWQESRPMDHFELDVTGPLVQRLPKDAKLKLVRNPEHDRNVVCEFKLKELPAVLPADFSRSGCVVEFWAPNVDGIDQCLFSVVVDSTLFDEFRVVTVKLDKPNPQLRPDYGDYAAQTWSPKISQRMRYRKLPWLDKATQMLAPIPRLPEMTVKRKLTGEIIERCPLEKEWCRLNHYLAYFAIDSAPVIEDGENLVFSVTYDSGLCEPITSEFNYRFNEKRDKFW